MRPIHLIVPVAVLVLALGCQRDIYTANEENPFYQKGLEHRENGRYEAAVREFESCVYYSPESYKAYHHLAVLYDDHLDDPYAAVVNYRRCIAGADADPAVRTQAQAGLERAERRIYERLAAQYRPAQPARPPRLALDEGPIEELQPPSAPAASPPASPPATPPPASPIAPPPDEPVAAVRPVPPPATPAPPQPAPDRGEFLRSRILATHTIASGDTLSKIAKQYYGDSSKWRFIYDANRDTLSAPEKLTVGQKIRIPKLDSGR